MAFATVPNALVDGGLLANVWINAALEPCGGRGGGKPNSAQGQAKECVLVDQIMHVATEFSKSTVYSLISRSRSPQKS